MRDFAKTCAAAALGIGLSFCAPSPHAPSPRAPSSTALAPAREPPLQIEEAPCTRAKPHLHRLALAEGEGCLIAGGKVHCWSGDAAALPEPITAHVPALKLPSEAVDVARSNWNGCAVLTSGAIHCWGENGQGQLGAGSRVETSSSPLPVVGLTHACAVAVSDEHTCAVERDGSVACWGGNGDGQTGQDTDYTFDVRHLIVARSVPRITGAVEVAVGAYGSCALDRTGVWCWGDAARGHSPPGAASVLDRTQPTRLPALEDATALSAAWSCGCAVRRGGAVDCFAMNSNGCVGLDPNLRWDHVARATGVRRIAVGPGGVCVETASALQCWRPIAARNATPAADGERVALPSGGIDDLAMGSAPCFRTGDVLRCWSTDDWQSAKALGEPHAIRIE